MAGFLDSLLQIISSPQEMNTIGTSLDAGGQGLGAFSRFRFGAEQREAMDFEAAQYRQQANVAQASAQRSAWSVDMATKYQISNAVAAAAAGGGGASDPTVVNIVSQMAGIGAYQRATALFEGEDKARLLENQATAKTYEGKILQQQSNLTGVSQSITGLGSIVRGAARAESMRKKFGDDAPFMVDFTGMR
jgi:hypothetical protein